MSTSEGSQASSPHPQCEVEVEVEVEALCFYRCYDTLLEEKHTSYMFFE